ncbi:EAL domain-containing protein [Stappia indica]|uniref:EAL domain-containing protein n=1 Tax=Stappia indica TaxID=538381 RepID=UPI002970090F|nr:EAL domain-containing protein [Stappia indica]
MKDRRDFSFNRFVLGLFLVALLATSAALFSISYVGSLSIVDHELERFAKREQTLARLVFEQNLSRLDTYLRALSKDTKLKQALRAGDQEATTRILGAATDTPLGAQFEMLLLDRPMAPDWADASFSIFDLHRVLPADRRQTLPLGSWMILADETRTDGTLVAAEAIPVVDERDGKVLGHLVGGFVLNDTIALLGELSRALETDSLALFHGTAAIASVGRLGSSPLDQDTCATLTKDAHMLAGDQLLVRSELKVDRHGHPLYVVTERPSETIENIRSTYLELFAPFLLYILAAALVAAYVLHRFTSPALQRLLAYASRIRRDSSDLTYHPGAVKEFNDLGRNLQHAFTDLRDTDRQFRELIDGSFQGVCIHADLEVLYLNRSLLNILGYAPSDRDLLVSRGVLALVAPEEHDRMKSYLRARKQGASAPGVFEAKGLSKTGERLWIELHVRPARWDDRDAYYVTITDISERKRQEELIIRQANFDMLTGLPNRTLFRDRLLQSIARTQWNGGVFALLFVDLDRFKNINDSLGHSAGDMLIKAAAERISCVLDDHDTVARLGGDEFAIILANARNVWEIEMQSARILEQLARPVMVNGNTEVFSTASIGITVSPNDGDDDEVLLRQADTAMYHAKAEGGNKLRFFSSSMNDHLARSMEIESSLRRALETQELRLHYQPLVDVANGQVIGCEALVRWNHPEKGPIPPADFIPVAEDTGLIVPLGAWVLEEACRFQRACADKGLSLPVISVNVSPRQCRDETFVDMVRETLKRTRMPARCLHLEITESVMFDETGASPIETLNAIRDLGVRLSLDDFGTGYSSLSNLKRFPIDTLKIDQSFVRDLETDEESRALVKAIIAMAASLGINVIAEGAETQGQCQTLLALGCRQIQGYHLGRPMPGAEFLAYLDQPDKADRLDAGVA